MKTILVIDDDKVTLEILKQALSKEGYDVLAVGTGKEGLDAYRKKPVDLIITDLLMPGTSGLAVIEKLKQEFSSVTIFAITAGTSGEGNDFLHMAQVLGAKRTFRKPLDCGDLIKAVNEVLG